jgi:hypothetical protein
LRNLELSNSYHFPPPPQCNYNIIFLCEKKIRHDLPDHCTVAKIAREQFIGNSRTAVNRVASYTHTCTHARHRSALSAQLFACRAWDPDTQRELFATGLSRGFQIGTCTVLYRPGKVKYPSAVICLSWLIDRSSCWTDLDGHVFITCTLMTCALSAWAKGDYLSIYLSIYRIHTSRYTHIPARRHPERPRANFIIKWKEQKKSLQASQTFDCIQTTFKNPPILGHFPRW